VSKWVENVLKQAAENPGPRLARREVELCEFIGKLKKVWYDIELYVEMKGCQFQVSMKGELDLKPDGLEGYMMDGRRQVCFVEHNHQWFSLPKDIPGYVLDIDLDTWILESGHFKIKLCRKEVSEDARG